MFAMDYLKRPVGMGGYREVLLFVNFITRYTWGFMAKWPSHGKFSVKCLRMVTEGFCAPPPSSFVR